MSRSSAATVVALTVLGLAFTGCSSSGGDGGGSAVQKLSPEQQKAFETWVASPVKSCQAMEVVGGASVQIEMPSFPGMPAAPSRPSSRDAVEKGIDLDVYKQKTGGSLWLSGSRQDLAVIDAGEPEPFTQGQATSRFSQSIEVNGSKQSVEVVTESSGYDCSVQINGQNVAKVRIAKKIRLAGAGKTGAAFQALELSESNVIERAGSYANLNLASVNQAVLSQYKDMAAAVEAIRALGYSEDQARSYFEISPRAAGGLGLRSLDGQTEVLGFGGEVVLTAGQDELMPKAGVDREVYIQWQLATGRGETRLILRRVRMSLSGGKLSVADLGQDAVQTEVMDAARGLSCAENRSDILAGLAGARLQAGRITRTISKASVVQPCVLKDEKLNERLQNTTNVLRLYDVASRHVAGPGRGVRDFDFGDWTDDITSATTAALDPVTAGLSYAGGHLALVEMGVQAVRQAAGYSSADANLRSAFTSAILATVSRGAIEADRDVLTLAASVAGRLGADFNAPIRYSLLRLELGGGGDARQHFQFAQAVSASYIQVAKETLAEALSVGYSDYVTEVHRRLFELRTPESELITRADKIRKFKAALQKYAISAKVRSALAPRVLGDRATIQAGALDEAMRVASILNEATEDLATEFVLLYDHGDAQVIDLARAWALGLSKADLAEIRSYVAEATAAGLSELASENVSEMLMSRPNSSQIRAYRESLKVSQSFLSAEAARAQSSQRDSFYESKAKELSNRILREGWSAAEVSALEPFATIAASDTFCADYKTLSLRLDCARLDRFSKGKGKVFDPAFGGRYIPLAQILARAVAAMVPATNHTTARREIKDGFYPTFDDILWGRCADDQFQANRQKLETVLAKYQKAGSDFFKKTEAERELSAAFDLTCR
ncbi:MAG: hypothetical protein IPJ84_16795 [Bdellovibrionales bacterium]|nr:hypothetical protein [Bdellovibrionales bacterium]